MKSVIFLLLFLPLASFAGNSSTFKGYSKINQIVHERIATENGFELGQYLDKIAIVPASGDLLSLLGTYDGSDTNSTYRNGDPNSINMLLWYIALDELAADIANQCASMNAITPAPPSSAASSTVQPLVLLPELQAALQPLCQWPASSAKTNDVLYGFWSALLGYDAPPEEFQAWKDFFLTESSYDSAPLATVISDMGVAALYNPYFLLEP